MRDAFPIVCKLGDRFRIQEANRRGGWRDAKALVVLVAQRGDWNGAACLAEALGMSPDVIESIYREVYGDEPQTFTITITTAGGATPAQPPKERTA